ncbi:hypothetical protein OS493_031680 [Desmophyllum pertusum]|uniref:Uncharacterized protein n=1 Tax=Desmophyllum pertusum TaxID=174260 RepID=A0A9W9ZX08_9CNID|nr:hypothetical protein OS493_031680 [Desmophyllum pertusum]
MRSYCAKLKAQACENGTAELIKALPGAKVDACDVQCCDDKDNCNTKDLVKLPGPSDKPTIALAAYTGASLAISIMSLLAGIAISAY